jgi:hypothetical protein
MNYPYYLQIIFNRRGAESTESIYKLERTTIVSFVGYEMNLAN